MTQTETKAPTEPAHPYEGLSYDKDDSAVEAALSEVQQKAPPEPTPKGPTGSSKPNQVAPKATPATAPIRVDRSEAVPPAPVGLKGPLRGSTVDVQRSPSPQEAASSPPPQGDGPLHMQDVAAAKVPVEEVAEVRESVSIEADAKPPSEDLPTVKQIETPVAVDRMEAPSPNRSTEVVPQQTDQRVEQPTADTPRTDSAVESTEESSAPTTSAALPGASSPPEITALPEIEVTTVESQSESRVDRSFAADQPVEPPAGESQVETPGVASQTDPVVEVQVPEPPGPLDISTNEVVVTPSTEVGLPTEAAQHRIDRSVGGMRPPASAQPQIDRAAAEEGVASPAASGEPAHEPTTATATTSASLAAEPQPLDISVIETIEQPEAVAVDHEDHSVQTPVVSAGPVVQRSEAPKQSPSAVPVEPKKVGLQRKVEPADLFESHGLEDRVQPTSPSFAPSGATVDRQPLDIAVNHTTVSSHTGHSAPSPAAANEAAIMRFVETSQASPVAPVQRAVDESSFADHTVGAEVSSAAEPAEQANPAELADEMYERIERRLRHDLMSDLERRGYLMEKRR